jgi:hypothetical protein
MPIRHEMLVLVNEVVWMKKKKDIWRNGLGGGGGEKPDIDNWGIKIPFVYTTRGWGTL